jgi:hypothetical protein
MPPKEKPQPYINTHIIPTPGHPIVRKTTPVTNGQITIITPINLPNTKPVTQPQHIIIPTSQPLSNNSDLLTLSNLPNTTTDETKQDNTLTYVLIAAVIVGFIILSNKDI